MEQEPHASTSSEPPSLGGRAGRSSGETTTLFSPGAPPSTVAYEQLVVRPSGDADRGSRAETVTYGGGLRPTSRRIIVVVAGVVLLVGALVTLLARLNAESADRYPAAVVPAHVLNLNFSSTRPLAGLRVSPGERVAPGQVLAVQADPTGAAELIDARAALAADARRSRALAAALSLLRHRPKALETVLLRAELASNEAAAAEARLQVANYAGSLAATVLRSPIAGVVLAVAGTPGQLVGPSGVRGDATLGVAPSAGSAGYVHLFPQSVGQSTNLSALSSAVVSVVQGRRWQFVAEIPESAAIGVRAGEHARFSFDTAGEPSLRAVVTHVLHQPIEVSGQVSYEVLAAPRASLPPGILPGMSGTLQLAPTPLPR